jgi:hypothetical protein
MPDTLWWRKAAPWAAVIALGAAIAGVALYKTLPLLYPPVTARAPLDPDCVLRESPCRADFPSGGTVTLDIQPRGIPVLEPLRVTAELRGLPTPERVELDLAGVDMDMGYNRQPLEADPGTPTRYIGSTMLPVCVRERMTWEARVLIHLSDGLLAAPFRFESFRSGFAPAD